MAGKKRSRKRKKGGGRFVCPKTRGGKKVRASGGRCWTKSYVKKIRAGKKGRKRGRRRRKR